MHGDMWLFYGLIGLCIVACGLAGVCHWSTCLVVGFAVAAVLSFFKKGLIVVAVCSCAAVLITELCMIYVF